MTRVVNLRAEPYDRYIGRPSPFGNPFGLGQYTRAESISRYRIWFAERLLADPAFRASVEALRGHRLGCYCKPLACHGDVIVEHLEDA